MALQRHTDVARALTVAMGATVRAYKLRVGLVCVQLQDSPDCTTTVGISDVEPTIFCRSRRVRLAAQESSSYFCRARRALCRTCP